MKKLHPGCFKKEELQQCRQKKEKRKKDAGGECEVMVCRDVEVWPSWRQQPIKVEEGRERKKEKNEMSWRIFWKTLGQRA